MKLSLGPEVLGLAHASDGPMTAAQLSSLGRSRNWQSEASRKGLLHKPSRGLYVVAERWEALSPWQRYEVWARGVGLGWANPYSGSRALSHQSAAVLWGLPLLSIPSEVHLVDARGAARRTRDGIRIHHSDLSEGTGRRAGVVVTALSRTIVDCCAAGDFAQAVAVADAGLAGLMRSEGGPQGTSFRPRGIRGVDVGPQETHRTALLDLVDRRRPVGAHLARKALRFADARSESAAESRARVAMHLLGYPAPELQIAVRTPRGTFDPDFAFPGAGVLAEVDGAVKTSAPFNGDAASSVERERRRHISLQEQGWEIARFTWAELGDMTLIRGKLDAAFARAKRRGLGR
jgi:very-short-patch-repair endonuclease